MVMVKKIFSLVVPKGKKSNDLFSSIWVFKGFAAIEKFCFLKMLLLLWRF
jgi:hypothetical protein